MTVSEQTPIRGVVAAAIVAMAGIGASGAAAQQAAPVQAGDPEFFVVGGLAMDDELNLRATASATGMLVGRVINGTMVRNLGCSEVKDYIWCKVADPEVKGVEGWAAGRYLIGEASGQVDVAEPSDASAGTGGESGIPPELAALLPGGDPETRVDAKADIPCAREFGQPVRMCAAQVKRGDVVGSAEITVMWPDGGMRIITFKAGKAEGSDSSDEFRTTREGDLNLIRVGKGERFEITDAFAIGG